jgi:hypothetical protein
MLVRTTIRLPEPLKKAVEKKAIEENTTFQEVVTRALHTELRNHAKKNAKKLIIPTFDLGVPLDNLTRDDYYPDPTE